MVGNNIGTVHWQHHLFRSTHHKAGAEEVTVVQDYPWILKFCTKIADFIDFLYLIPPGKNGRRWP